MERRKVLCRTLDYIDQHINENINLFTLSEVSGYSAVQLTRLFGDYVGTTPMRYISTMRVIRASRLVSDTDLRITDIAFACGFESLEVFERSFKRYFGASAAKFRGNAFAEPDPFYMSANIYYERLRKQVKIDNGASFNWGRTASEYAKYRNIYPVDFFENLNRMGVKGQKVLDIGTGTGILPMNMAKYGGEFIGADLSHEMIAKAKQLCSDIPNVRFVQADAHHLPFDNESFDAVTVLQCWVYFDKEILIPELLRIIRPDGHLYIMFMTWLPDEDEIIRKSFRLVRKYNPDWSGFMKRFDVSSFDYLKKSFSVVEVFRKDYRLQFTKESWCGRMTASRGIGATLNDDEIARFKNELMEMLDNDRLSILHEAVIVKLRKEQL